MGRGQCEVPRDPAERGGERVRGEEVRGPTSCVRRLLVASCLCLAGCAESAHGAPGVAGDAGGDGAHSAPTAQHPYDAGGLQCVDYPDAGYRLFPFDPSALTTSFPGCTPSCHPVLATAGAGQAPLDQNLPSGPCDDEGATCDSAVMAGWCPPCRGAGGPGSGYRCDCVDHLWRCAVRSQGSSGCEPPACLGLDGGGCPSSQWTTTATQVCACGVCRARCASDAECPSGRCQVAELCFLPDGYTCPGPAECPATCTGFCD